MKTLWGVIMALSLILWGTAGWALSGGELLREPIGARQVGMGETGAALAGDVEAVGYNCAGLAALSTMQVSSMMALNSFDNKNLNLDFGLPVHWIGQGGLALSVINLMGADMTINYLDGTAETLTSQNDYVLTAGYGQQLTSALAVGVSFKAFYSRLLEEYEAMAFGADIGVQYQLQDLPGLRIGMALQNMGTPIVYESSGDPMPTLLRLGAAYRLPLAANHGLTVIGDVLMYNDDTPKEHLGLEYGWNHMLFLRAGYKVGYEFDSFTAGAGIDLDGLKLDYAFVLKSTVESVHRFSLGYAFGAGKP